jgi:hypothetical protein
MIEYIQHLFQFTADESCGKCFPCRLGSTRGKELIAKAREDDSFKIDRELLDDLLDTMEITSLCALGGGVPLPIKNALQHFDDELGAILSVIFTKRARNTAPRPLRTEHSQSRALSMVQDLSTSPPSSTANRIASSPATRCSISSIATKGRGFVPTLCDAPQLEPYGACRVCSVEVALQADGPRRVVASCHTPLAAGMHVFTESPKVRRCAKTSSNSCSRTIRWTA